MHFKRYPLLIFFLGCMAFTGLASAETEYDEGIEYKRLKTPVANHTESKVEVVELFWYGCPHCFHLEPELHKWLKKKPSNVSFVRVPAVFSKPWAMHAKAYYTAEFLGVLDKIHKPLFEAIHVRKQRMMDVNSIRKLFVNNGVSAEDFDNTFNSFAVDSKVRRATDLSRRYKIDGVPAMVVNGKYMTDGPMAGGQDKMLKMVDYFVKKESAN